jgi:hypothetical protein
MVEIYKAHLIKDVKIFVKNLYQNVLYKFAR